MPPTGHHRLHSWLLAALCGMVAALAVLPGLGRRPLLDAEARYALVGVEMLRSGDWIQPRLNTFPYYEKPPLLYWSLAATYRAFGEDERSSRLPERPSGRIGGGGRGLNGVEWAVLNAVRPLEGRGMVFLGKPSLPDCVL